MSSNPGCDRWFTNFLRSLWIFVWTMELKLWISLQKVCCYFEREWVHKEKPKVQLSLKKTSNLESLLILSYREVSVVVWSCQPYQPNLSQFKVASPINPILASLRLPGPISPILANLNIIVCIIFQVCRHWYNVVWDHPILWTSIIINNPNIDIDRALKYLTRRLSYNTPKVRVCVHV